MGRTVGRKLRDQSDARQGNRHSGVERGAVHPDGAHGQTPGATERAEHIAADAMVQHEGHAGCRPEGDLGLSQKPPAGKKPGAFAAASGRAGEQPRIVNRSAASKFTLVFRNRLEAGTPSSLTVIFPEPEPTNVQPPVSRPAVCAASHFMLLVSEKNGNS